MTSAAIPGMAQLYYSTCWKQHVTLSLSMWSAIQKGINVPKGHFLLQRLWLDAFISFADPDVTRAVFVAARDQDERSLHDAQSPSLNLLLDLLDTQGDAVEGFKPNVYGVAAMLVIHARSLQQISNSLVSADQLSRVFIERFLRPPNSDRREFFLVALAAAETVISGRPFSLSAFVGANPEYKTML